MLESLSLIKCALAPKGIQKVFSIQCQCTQQVQGQALFCAASAPAHNTVLTWPAVTVTSQSSGLPQEHNTLISTNSPHPLVETTLQAVQDFLPRWQEASPSEVPRKAGDHAQTLTAMMLFRNTATSFPLPSYLKGLIPDFRGNCIHFWSFPFVNLWQFLQKQF